MSSHCQAGLLCVFAGLLGLPRTWCTKVHCGRVSNSLFKTSVSRKAAWLTIADTCCAVSVGLNEMFREGMVVDDDVNQSRRLLTVEKPKTWRRPACSSAAQVRVLRRDLLGTCFVPPVRWQTLCLLGLLTRSTRFIAFFVLTNVEKACMMS